MERWTIWVAAAIVALTTSPLLADDLDQVLSRENRELGVESKPVAPVDDWAFLRRIHVDLIGRIPTGSEIRQFMEWPAAERRQRLIDKLLADPRFADRWTVFFADMLRIRSNSPGGAAFIAYVHQALQEDQPYDELARRLIATNGRANRTPEVGFVLGDNADPLALASVTSQVFLGVRIGCAQCHDHPFDVWTREDFYGLAAYYGKTRRVESQLTRVIYTTESPQSTVLWPPEDDSDGRKPMQPRFPFDMLKKGEQPEFLKRLVQLRSQKKPQAGPEAPSVDDLLAATDSKVKVASGLLDKKPDIVQEARGDIRKIDLEGSLYRHSQLRTELAEMVTSPRNRLFPRALVNRVWRELIGQGFVEPVDDFREDNPPSHPETLDFLSDEFVAGGYSFRQLVELIVTSDVYQRQHAPRGVDDVTRTDLESNFLATPVRRMISESLYDSIVAAGHLFDLKYRKGENMRVVVEQIRVPKPGTPAAEDAATPLAAVVQGGDGGEAMAAMRAPAGGRGGYGLEDAIELDFTALLKAKDDGPDVERMRIVSREELEAQRMQMEARRNRPRTQYEMKTVERQYDDNPQFNSSLRMASPAPAGHFLRVFGQPSRAELGELREDVPTMRQALMMLNGRLTNEASRVGTLEPIYPLLVGKSADPNRAIKMAYYEVLTRPPTSDELSEARQILGEEPLQGMADLRWVLLNCNEFRFLP